MATEAPAWSRVAAIILGVGGAFTLLITQWVAWPRGRQWVLIVVVLMLTGAVFAYHLSWTEDWPGVRVGGEPSPPTNHGA